MNIGQALRIERLNLGLSQKEMCKGIVSRPFYAKVEAGTTGISANSLFEILIRHQIDINGFYKRIYGSMSSNDNKLNEKFQLRMNDAVNTKNIKLLDQCCHEILLYSDNEILRLRAIITVAYFKGELDKLDDNIKINLKKQFDEGEKWVSRPELLKLFANSMPLWSQDELDFFINRLLKKVDKQESTELMQERYLRILGNYLTTCYERKIYNNPFHRKYIDSVIKYIISATLSFHFMIYRINAVYMKALFEGNDDMAKNIIYDLRKLGYRNLISSWPECNKYDTK